MPIIKGKKILDLGCGIGELLDYADKDSMGIDCNEEVIEQARKLGRNVIYGELPSCYCGDKFDVVILSQVLEHLSSLQIIHKTLELAKEHLNDNGMLIIGTPYIYDNVQWLHPEHISGFTVWSLKLLVESHGFKIINEYVYWHLPGELWLMEHGIGNYRCFIKRDYILKLISNFNLIRGLTLIGRKVRK